MVVNQDPLISSQHSVSWSSPDQKVKTSSKTNDPTVRILGANYVPKKYDVVCARGKQAYNHPGNKFLRTLIEHGKSSFGNATCKRERTQVISNIVNSVRQRGNGFVKAGDRPHNKGVWYDIGDYQSREKVSYLLRNANSAIYKSSSQAKKARKKGQSPRIVDGFTRMLKENATVGRIIDDLHHNLEEKSLSDDEVMKMFNDSNSKLLSCFKQDLTLMIRFHAIANLRSAATPSDDDTASYTAHPGAVPSHECMSSDRAHTNMLLGQLSVLKPDRQPSSDNRLHDSTSSSIGSSMDDDETVSSFCVDSQGCIPMVAE